MTRMRTRIAIVGAGPAGCAAALTLRRYLPELNVELICMPANESVPAVGETLSPGVLPLLKYLGINEEFLRSGHLACGGTASAWGTSQVFERNYLFTGRGDGWHVDRSDFDAWLLDRAETAGARCIRSRARRVCREEDRWYIDVDGSDTIVADAIVDASGRSAWFARHQGFSPRRDDVLVAEARWYVHDQFEHTASGALVESTADGWWYSATLPRQRGVAMFMTDNDLRNRATWEDRISGAPATRARLASWRLTGEIALRAANSQQACAVAGDGWVAAGDAAAAFDPISSLGIGFSLRSGMEAARVAVATAERDEVPAASYAASIARIYTDYQRRLRIIYERERRWARGAFWARRQGSLRPEMQAR